MCFPCDSVLQYVIFSAQVGKCNAILFTFGVIIWAWAYRVLPNLFNSIFILSDFVQCALGSRGSQTFDVDKFRSCPSVCSCATWIIQLFFLIIVHIFHSECCREYGSSANVEAGVDSSHILCQREGGAQPFVIVLFPRVRTAWSKAKSKQKILILEAPIAPHIRLFSSLCIGNSGWVSYYSQRSSTALLSWYRYKLEVNKLPFHLLNRFGKDFQLTIRFHYMASSRCRAVNSIRITFRRRLQRAAVRNSFLDGWSVPPTRIRRILSDPCWNSAMP